MMHSPADEFFTSRRPRLRAVHLQNRRGGWDVALVVYGHYRGRDEAIAKAEELQASVDRITTEAEIRLYRSRRDQLTAQGADNQVQADSSSGTPEARRPRVSSGDDE